MSDFQHLVNKFIHKKTITFDLMGLADDERSIDKLSSFCSAFILEHRRHTIDLDRQAYIFIALSLIAMIHYDNGFWPHVHEQLSNLYDGNLGADQSVDTMTRAILRRISVHLLGQNNLRPIYIPLMEAIVTKNTYGHYLSLFYDVYKYNFNFYFNPDDDDISKQIEFVYEALKRTINIGDEKEEESTEIGYGTTKKTYILSRYTQAAIYYQSRYLTPLIKLAIISLRFIDNWYWERPAYRTNLWLDYAFDEWAEQHQQNRHTKTETVRETRELLRKPVWSFSNVTQQVFLKPKTLFVFDNIDPKNIEIVITQDNTSLSIPYENIHIQDILGGYEINARPIEITQPLSNISYKVADDTHVVYATKDSFNREIIFFDPEGREVMPGHNYSGPLFVICHQINPSILHPVSIKDNYSIGYFIVSQHESYCIDGKSYQFCSNPKPHLIGNRHNGSVAIFKNKELDIYTSIEGFAFISSPRLTNSRLIIDGKEIDINEYIKENSGVIDVIENTIIHMTAMQPDIHRISFFATVDNEETLIFEKEFVVDPNFNIEQQENMDGGFDIKLSTWFSDEIYDTHLCPGCVETTVNIKTSRGSVLIYKILSEEIQYSLDTQWNPISQPLVQSLLNSNSTLKIFSLREITAIKMALDDGTDAYTLKPQRSSGYVYEFDVGFLTSIKKIKDPHIMQIESYDWVVGEIEFYKTNVLISEKTNIQFNDNHELIVEIDYLGKNQMFLRLSGIDMDFCEKITDDKQKIIRSTLPFIKYKLEIFEYDDFLADTELSLFSDYYYYFSQNDLVGHNFKVTKVSYVPYSRNRHMFLSETTRTIRNENPVVLKFVSKLDNGQFVGKLYDLYPNGLLQERRVSKILVAPEDVRSKYGFFAQCTDSGGDELLFDTSSLILLDENEHSTAQPIEALFLSLVEVIN